LPRRLPSPWPARDGVAGLCRGGAAHATPPPLPSRWGVSRAPWGLIQDLPGSRERQQVNLGHVDHHAPGNSPAISAGPPPHPQPLAVGRAGLPGEGLDVGGVRHRREPQARAGSRASRRRSLDRIPLRP
jgi:hypothetical protein